MRVLSTLRLVQQRHLVVFPILGSHEQALTRMRNWLVFVFVGYNPLQFRWLLFDQFKFVFILLFGHWLQPHQLDLTPFLHILGSGKIIPHGSVGPWTYQSIDEHHFLIASCLWLFGWHYK